MNVKGREPKDRRAVGVRERAGRPRAQARRHPGRERNPIPTVVHKPEDVYDQVSGVAPDLIVHFGDLLWRSVGTVGGPDGVHTFENDTGPDDANHAQEGLFVLVAPGVGQVRVNAHLLDIAPTVLERHRGSSGPRPAPAAASSPEPRTPSRTRARARRGGRAPRSEHGRALAVPPVAVARMDAYFERSIELPRDVRERLLPGDVRRRSSACTCDPSS